MIAPNRRLHCRLDRNAPAPEGRLQVLKDKRAAYANGLAVDLDDFLPAVILDPEILADGEHPLAEVA